MREGIIPTIVGTGVTATGMAMKKLSTRRTHHHHNVVPVLAAGVIGFGLAHILLGSIDLFERR